MAYVALKVELPGFPDAHITVMYCESTTLSLETVRNITEAVMRHTPESHVSIRWNNLTVLGEGDKSVVAVVVETKIGKAIHDVLKSCGLRHSYPDLLEHITLTPEMSETAAAYVMELLLKVVQNINIDYDIAYTLANILDTPIVEEISSK